MNKYLLVALAGFLYASCAAPKQSNMYCSAAESDVSVKNIAVHNLYAMGTLEHGSKVIDPACPALLFEFSSLQNQASGRDEKYKRVMTFNAARFGSPMTKSGMFELDGQVDVYPDDKLVRLVDVSRFREIEMTEKRQILDRLRSQRSSDEGRKP